MKWQNPPGVSGPDNSGKVRYRAEAEALRSRPGEWALVIEDALPQLSTNIKQGRLVAFGPAGSFEATARKREDGRADIYARYVGGAA